jgi:single-stranded-DNA-specific exonuclease
VRQAKLHEKPDLDGEDLAFALAPRLNAAGRLGQAELAIELLSTTSTERAVELAKYLDELNENRKTLERSVTRSAQKQIDEHYNPAEHAALVLADRDWHAGVIGIVAGKLAEKYHRPVVVIALDDLGVKPASGSGRSAGEFNLHEALGECREHLVSYGGHTAAAGLKIDERNIDPFRKAFCACAERGISKEERTAELFVDAETPLAALTLQAVTQIEGLAPFGHGNERPMLCTSDVKLAAPPQRIGAAGRHLSLRLEQHGIQLRAVAFGNGDWEPELLRVDQPIAVAFRPVINNFRGRKSVEVHLQDWKRES